MSHRILVRTDQPSVQALGTNALLESRQGWTIVTRDDLEPREMNDVWFITNASTLPGFAKQLSEQLQTVCLAILNWENDVLKIWVFERGALKLEYDSNPSFVSCTITPPEGIGGELAVYAGVPDKAQAVKKLLARRRGLGFINETQRLEQLSVLLNAPLV